MAESSIWWLLAGAAVAVELMTGTFYLLMLAVGFAAAALAAHVGFGVAVQLVTAAVVGGGAVTAWHVLRGKKMQGAPAQSNQDVNMDIGQTVQVHNWHADGEQLGQQSCSTAAAVVLEPTASRRSLAAA